MFKRDDVDYQFHHIGIPTTEVRECESYSTLFKMYTSDSECQLARTQFHRFEPGSSLHPLIQTLPHVAFKVSDLDRAVQGCRLLLGPYEPIRGFRVAIIEDGGHPVELVETELSDDELWSRTRTESRI